MIFHLFEENAWVFPVFPLIIRGVEIVKFSTCPGTTNWPYCTCPKKILLVPKNRLADTFLCFIMYSFENSLKPDINCLVNSVDQPADQDLQCFQCNMGTHH